MKAKEYAAQLAAASTTETYENLLFAALDELTQATLSSMKSRQSGASSMGCLRETFTKWKSIVANVKATKPELVIDDALFVKYFAHVAPALFAMAVDARVFLGYTLDAEDRSTLASGQAAVRAAERRDRLLALQREATLLGIPLAPLLVTAMLRGEV